MRRCKMRTNHAGLLRSGAEQHARMGVATFRGRTTRARTADSAWPVYRWARGMIERPFDGGRSAEQPLRRRAYAGGRGGTPEKTFLMQDRITQRTGLSSCAEWRSLAASAAPLHGRL